MSKIMVVDDEPYIRTLVKVILEKEEGYDVVEVESGEECLKRLKKEKPDIILLDVMMPGEDGWETCRKIKGNEETTDIPVAMFTVRTCNDSAKKSLESGADAHINKPFDMEELLDAVEGLLGKHASS